MNEINYSAQAKEDLARINWKTRERIIKTLAGTHQKHPTDMGFKQLHDTDMIKLKYEGHIIIGKVAESELNILAIRKEQRLRLPE